MSKKTSQSLRPRPRSSALYELDLTWISAHSPQAKGRVERSFGTAQDRLIKYMRIRGISDIETANRFLEDYMPLVNRRFTVPPACDVDAHRSCEGFHLDAIFSHQETRTIMADYTVQYNNDRYQILKDSAAPGMVRSKLTVQQPAGRQHLVAMAARVPGVREDYPPPGERRRCFSGRATPSLHGSGERHGRHAKARPPVEDEPQRSIPIPAQVGHFYLAENWTFLFGVDRGRRPVLATGYGVGLSARVRHGEGGALFGFRRERGYSKRCADPLWLCGVATVYVASRSSGARIGYHFVCCSPEKIPCIGCSTPLANDELHERLGIFAQCWGRQAPQAVESVLRKVPQALSYLVATDFPLRPEIAAIAERHNLPHKRRLRSTRGFFGDDTFAGLIRLIDLKQKCAWSDRADRLHPAVAGLW